VPFRSVEAFLRQHPGAICAECVAAKVGISRRLAAMATLGLCRSPRFERMDAVCPQCGERRRLIRPVPGSA
jgi:hypothetical protein